MPAAAWSSRGSTASPNLRASSASAGPGATAGAGTGGTVEAGAEADDGEGAGEDADADSDGRPEATPVAGTSVGGPGGAAHPAQSRATSAKAVDAAHQDRDADRGARPAGTKPARDKTRAIRILARQGRYAYGCGDPWLRRSAFPGPSPGPACRPRRLVPEPIRPRRANQARAHHARLALRPGPAAEVARLREGGRRG